MVVDHSCPSEASSTQESATVCAHYPIDLGWVPGDWSGTPTRRAGRSASAVPVDQCVKMHVMPPVCVFQVALKGCFEVKPGPNGYTA